MFTCCDGINAPITDSMSLPNRASIAGDAAHPTWDVTHVTTSGHPSIHWSNERA